jgi:hypothetical protein
LRAQWLRHCERSGFVIASAVASSLRAQRSNPQTAGHAGGFFCVRYTAESCRSDEPNPGCGCRPESAAVFDLAIAIVSRRRVFGILIVVFPFIGLAIVFALSAYTGCDIQDRPFAFLGDDCYKHGTHWNEIAAPLGMLSLSWIIIGPAIWVAFLVIEKLTRLAKAAREKRE